MIEIGDLGNGSGTLIAPNRMLTAAHVAVEGMELRVGPNKKIAKVIKIDLENDLALLDVKLACPCIPISAGSQPKVDDPIILVGFPVNFIVQTQILTHGYVQGLVQGNRLQVTADAVGGNSGGGMFRQVEGKWEVAGVLVEGVVMGFTPVSYLSRVVDLVTVQSFLPSMGYVENWND